MSKNKSLSDDLELISLDIETIRSDAGKRSDSNSNTNQSGIEMLNEGFGISLEYFTKNKDSKESSDKVD
ncbi:hypothetical protein [Desulfosporosinus hippei]|uniref:Uncharacterized protein n=1 Tax=Desulfosporosinus hippei DSM 8344 TaxID=1121419 RepID=A0A1G8FMZ1_9FIRM|nr:hypothetical protein [Desulfosporosinus hippei]SDH83533.1 hypothetical protein SAMN05443529_12021 [Desulfosporosinus hippei DSM 8344]